MQRRNWVAIFAVFVSLFAPIDLACMSVSNNEPLTTTSAPAKPAEDLVTVLVARRFVPRGTLIKQPEEWFEAKSLPPFEVSQHAVSQISNVKDVVMSRALAKGETFKAEDLIR